ncbi:MAG: PAS domain-containing protein [Asticcacaulis sp.]
MSRDTEAGQDRALRHALEHTPAAFGLFDKDGQCVWANAAWLAFRGRILADETGAGWRDGVHSSDLEPVSAGMSGAALAGEVVQLRYRLRRHDGQYRWVLHQAAPRYDAEGRTTGFIVTLIDIHDAVIADIENTRFFNIASDILLTTRADGYIGKINAAIERVLGWSADEITRFRFTDLVHPDDLEATYALREPMLRGVEIVDFENRYRHKDGTYRWLSWRCRYDADCGVAYACAVDITQRKQSEAELKQTIERFNLAISASSEGVWDYDLDSRELYVSQRYRDMLGIAGTEGPITPEQWKARIHPEDLGHAVDTQMQYIRGLIPEYRVVFRMRHENGGWRTMLSRGTALRDADGRAYRMVGIHADITEQRELEDHLRVLKAQAEAANRAKSEFLANMSHEIRTPMNAVVGAAHILSMGTLAPEKQTQVIGVLKQGANSMLELINDLLDLSRIEARGLELQLGEFDARELVADVVRMLELQAGAKGLNIQQRNECACVNERLFIGDAARIRQILANLCSNAVKFTDSGAISVDILCQPTGAPGIEELRFIINDTGIGIEAEKLEMIFGKFAQADSSVSRRYGGSGLGLTISRALAESMGGGITASSAPGIGSTFVVRLPLERAGARETGATASRDGRAAVLLVEDSPGNVLIASHFLEEFGYGFEVATTGIEAVERIRGGARYDAILMDIQMPEMDGREATRQIRRIEKAQNRAPCRIIAMTAHAMLSDREQCLAAGMDDYITKPFDPAVLNAKLRAAMAAVVAEASAIRTGDAGSAGPSHRHDPEPEHDLHP